jgi:hypothetical protein
MGKQRLMCYRLDADERPARRWFRQIELESPLQGLTEEGRQTVKAIADRHGVSSDAVCTLLMALVAGGGRQAQFNHPDLGGMGQWSQGGMIMVGDMFNQGLKYRVDQLCNELATVLANSSPLAPASMQQQSQSSGMSRASGVSLFVPGGIGNRWPAELGSPSSVGSQNDLHYALFPNLRRLAISQGGRITVYDTGDHQIEGFSQQQSGDQSLTFISQHGLVRVADLKIVQPKPDVAPEPQAQSSSPRHPMPDPAPSAGGSASTATGVDRSSPAGPVSAQSDDEIFSKLERLAELRKKEIISLEEFNAKKAELLARL